MSNIKLQRLSNLKGDISIPPDKSISHRAIMISSIAKGESRIFNMLDGLDCISTVDAFTKMGIEIKKQKGGAVTVNGRGLRGLKRPDTKLYLGNSGTTMRLILGILAGQNFSATLTGDDSLSKRPMKRVTRPLREMGASIQGLDDANLAPITINGGRLKAIDYKSPVASAQVKSSVLFAGLYADGKTKVTEPYKSRDHTERMLKAFGAELKEEATSVSVRGLREGEELKPQSINVPGDISSAAFFMALGILPEGCELILRSCGINPTRDGIIKVLKRMGANLKIVNRRDGYEPIADIIVNSSSLSSTDIAEKEIPLLIDEIPVIALCATQAKGTTVIKGISELRVKETDRVNSIVTSLRKMGADIDSGKDSIIVKGPSILKGAEVDSFGDHRSAMMLAIAGAIADGITTVRDTDCIATSFPNFMDILNGLV